MIDEIKTRIRLGQYEFSAHALTRSVQRTILVDELVEAVNVGSIIELYKIITVYQPALDKWEANFNVRK